MLFPTINTTRILSSSASTESPRPVPALPFPTLPVEINEQIVQCLSLLEQIQFRRVSKGAANIGWSVLNSEFKYVFDSLQKIWRFLDDAERYAKRSAEQIKQALLILSSLGAESPVKPLLPASARLKEPIHDYPEDAAFDQALREAGILPTGLDLKPPSRDWLRTPRNLLGILRWVPREDMHRIMDAPSPLARRFQDVLMDLSRGQSALSWSQSAKLLLAMLKDDMGIDLGITENCDYLCEVAGSTNKVSQSDQLALGIEIATILLEKGVNIDAYNEYRYTALHLASLAGYDKMAAFLIDKGANVDARNKRGSTPLYFAAVRGRVETVKRLLRAGANLNTLDGAPLPLDMARRAGHAEITRLLEKAAEERTHEGV